MNLIRTCLSDLDMENLFELLGKLLKIYLSEEEYHTCFLKDETWAVNVTIDTKTGIGDQR